MTRDVRYMRDKCELLVLRARDAIKENKPIHEALTLIAAEIGKLELETQVPQFSAQNPFGELSLRLK